MKTTYLVWKDPSCNGINPDWQEITGQEFLALVRAKTGRRFIKLNSIEFNGSDGVIVMESTESVYKHWRKEKRHRQHLRDSDPGYQIVSYHAMETEDGCFGEELLRDDDCDVEAECFKKFEVEAINAAVASLKDDERQLVEYFYLSENRGTERGYAELIGIPKSTVNRRKTAILLKLKNILEE